MSSRKPAECSRCPTNSCLRSPKGTVDVCEWGVAYYTDGKSIVKKDTLVPLRYLSQNLRHELHRILAVIVEELNDIDSDISSKSINMTNPISRIFGSTIIIDNFVQMISGVHNFHPIQANKQSPGGGMSLQSIITKYFDVYSLIRNPRRSKNLIIEMNPLYDANISFGINCVEYMISVLIDNIWKYSVDGSTANVEIIVNADETANIIFTNRSKIIKCPDKIFERGYQQTSRSDGFGYGLFWIGLLIDYYNESNESYRDSASIEHDQKIVDDSDAIQRFMINNILIDLRN